MQAFTLNLKALSEKWFNLIESNECFNNIFKLISILFSISASSAFAGFFVNE